MQENFLSEIRKLAEEVSSREGCYLYDIEMVGAGGARVLRVTIDKEGTDKSGGVSVEDCSNVSRAMNLRLDVEDVVPGGQYQLEVSSPGLERVLKEPRHYQGAINKIIAIKSFAPLAQFNSELPIELAKAKQIQGPLLSFDDKGLKVGYLPAVKKGAEPLPQVAVFVPFESVTKAHVVFEFGAPAKPGHKPGKQPHPKALAKAGLQK
jgi:ribosome maturation factor RimP